MELRDVERAKRRVANGVGKAFISQSESIDGETVAPANGGAKAFFSQPKGIDGETVAPPNGVGKAFFYQGKAQEE